MRAFLIALIYTAITCTGCDRNVTLPSSQYDQKLSLNLSSMEPNYYIEFNVGWIPLIDYAFKDLTLTEPNSENLNLDCYQIVLSNNTEGNLVSFLSKLEQTQTTEDDQKVTVIRRNFDRCGPAITYLFDDNGRFLRKNYMR